MISADLAACLGLLLYYVTTLLPGERERVCVCVFVRVCVQCSIQYFPFSFLLCDHKITR